MLHFFRKFRKQFVRSGMFSRYMLYALGEIILVVIGILLALQINTWKQEANEKKLEKELTSRLHAEFNENNQLLQVRISEIDLNTQVSTSLMDLIANSTTPSNYLMDSLIYYTVEFSPYIPNMNTLDEIAQTAKMSTLKNQKLRNKIFEWTREFNNSKDGYFLFQRWIEEEYIPYLTHNIALKNVDKIGQLAWKTDSKFQNGYDIILKDRLFENIIDNHLYHLSRMQDSYKTLETIIEEITFLTKDSQ